MMRMTWVAIAASTLAACGSDGGNAGDDVATPDGAMPAGYEKLIGGSWTLAAGQTDTYHCVRYTVPEDTYITSFQAKAPPGTHHTVLSIAAPGSRVAGPDGEYNCQVSDLGTVMLFASGVGTDPLDFPDGVGIKIKAGTQIHLNLHLYNASDDGLVGTSELFVKKSSTPPPVLAEMAFSGKFQFSIPSNNMPTVVTGGCQAASDFTLFALWPHMHQTATHTKFEITHAGQRTTYLDTDYSFSEQTYWKQDPMIDVKQGDKIETTCTWVNNSGHTINFGDSSDAEMCFTGMYRYPATDANLFACTDTRGIGF